MLSREMKTPMKNNRDLVANILSEPTNAQVHYEQTYREVSVAGRSKGGLQRARIAIQSPQSSARATRRQQSAREDLDGRRDQ